MSPLYLDGVFVGPFIVPFVLAVCFISTMAAIFLVFYPRYQDNLLQRAGACLVALACLAISYHIVDGYVIPRAVWAYAWGIVLIVIGFLHKLPRKKS